MDRLERIRKNAIDLSSSDKDGRVLMKIVDVLMRSMRFLADPQEQTSDKISIQSCDNESSNSLRNIISDVSVSLELTMNLMVERERNRLSVRTVSKETLLKDSNGDQETAAARFRCEKCGKSMKSKESLYMHLRNHLTVEQGGISCKLCSKRYASANNLREHMRSHEDTEEKRLPFKCDQCERRFPKSSKLKLHEKVHSNQSQRERFACELCGKDFSTQRYLETHMTKHNATEERPHACTLCDKKYVNASTLRQHMKSHLPDDDPRKLRFKCKDCEEVFVDRARRNAHRAAHGDYDIHGRRIKRGRPFKCDLCEWSFGQIGTLNAHKIAMHNVDSRRKRRAPDRRSKAHDKTQIDGNMHEKDESEEDSEAWSNSDLEVEFDEEDEEEESDSPEAEKL